MGLDPNLGDLKLRKPHQADLLAGASLKVLLYPDPRLPQNDPAYVELFDLRHVVVHEDGITGMTSSTHFPVTKFVPVIGDAAQPSDGGAFYAYSDYVG